MGHPEFQTHFILKALIFSINEVVSKLLRMNRLLESFPFTIVSRSGTEIRELKRLVETYDMPYFPQHVLLCTSIVHDQSGDIYIQGYFRILG